ncbi:acetylornithine deacetylase [Paraferrimonas sp. SM1919]|uniref:acetylornithine deacetylase n=1 Tax=Paraferrimonas sp. SM1919 TaxID=2662263 RepID=UPI0013D2AE45|nr:acetylornithine deacetylase [Paraferrimonas sp. SM1919]
MKKLPSLQTKFQQLIATPSISALEAALDTDNGPVLDLLESWLTDLGFDCQRQSVANSRNKQNLIAKLGTGAGGLMLAGHTDTVPYDQQGWDSDPFTLTDKDNRWYGLGTCDMKGFFALVIEALSELNLAQLQKPIYIFASADEETTMAGAKALTTLKDVTPELAIIGEPTGLAPVYMHKGHMATGIRIHGRSGHSSDPEAGLNAIEVMHLVTSELIKLKDKLKQQYQQDDFSVPYPTLNFGAIKGGDAANRICGCCELQIDLRPLPGMKLQDLEELVRQALAPISLQYPNAVDVFALYPGSESFKGDVNDAIVEQLSQLAQQHPQVVNYATEAPYIQSLGCQTVVFGPGSIEQAHQPNEYIDTGYLAKTTAILKEVIYQNCIK